MENRVIPKITIDKGIPLPKKMTCRKHPFHLMEVGDSYLFPFEYSRANMAKYANAARNYGKNYSPRKRFTIKKVEGNKMRLWRIE